MVFQENELADTLLTGLLPISSKTSRYRGSIQVVLRQSDTIVLYEHTSETVRRHSPEAAGLIEDNLVYDYLTMGDGRLRGRRDSEAQTPRVQSLNAAVATAHIKLSDSKNFTSRYEIYDTMQKQHNTQSGLTKCSPKDTATCLNALAHNASFTKAIMHIERSLSINSYVKGQMHYRNLLKHTGLLKEGVYSYNIKEIFRFTQPPFERLHRSIKVRKAVSDMSFCFGNADIVAVAYGTYAYSVQVQAKTGNVCVWSIKNVLNPERTYSYNSPVTAVSFSPFDHSLVAVGLANGWLEVRDISVEHSPPLTVINRAAIASNDPVIAIKWYLKHVIPSQGFKRFIALSRSAVVRKYRFFGGTQVLTTGLTRLARARQSEGLSLHKDDPPLEHPAYGSLFCFNLTLDPLNNDLYYVLTDQGCIQNVSMTMDHSFSSPLRTHIYGSVNCMEFSPWSPKIFLTCGNDWYVLTGISLCFVKWLATRWTPISNINLSHSLLV